MSENAEDSATGLVDRRTTGEDRVRMVARQLPEPHTVNWIASEVAWSHEPTKRVLDRLVDDGGSAAMRVGRTRPTTRTTASR